MNICLINAPFGVEVTDIDLRQSLFNDTKAAGNDALVENPILVYRDKNFATPDQFLTADPYLGDPVATYRLPSFDAIEELINRAVDKLSGDNLVLSGDRSWHTVQSKLECSTKLTTLYAIELRHSG